MWFLNSKGELLSQRRSKTMTAHPDLWYNSASGHVSAGQTSLEAAQRETQEELGVTIPQTDFQFLFTIKRHVVLNEGTYNNNEFDDVFLVRSDLPLSDFHVGKQEVEDLKWISQEEFKKLAIDEDNIFVPEKDEYERLLEYISQNK